jgi:hypothetical protein
MKKNLLKKIFGKKEPEKPKVIDCGHDLEKYSCTLWDNDKDIKKEALLCKDCISEQCAKGNFVILG